MSEGNKRERSSGDRPRARRTDPARSAFRFDGTQSDEGIPELIRHLAEEGSLLAEQQLKLAQAEVHSAVSDLGESIGAMAGAAVLGIAGLGVLLMGLSFLLAKTVPLWAATLIIAVATLAGAYAMFLAGKRKLQSSSLSAKRTRRTLERAPAAISGETRKGQK